jgi:glycosyltransferase involved in cell wall biosynthesis
MFQLYTLADVSVTPTLYEGLPLVVLEAMACGKPIVASNVSEIPQVVKSGENGFLVPPRDPNAIANAILEIYDKDLFRKMGDKSKEIVKNYDWNVIAKKAISKYEDLIWGKK